MSHSVQHVARTTAANPLTKYVVSDDQPLPVKVMAGTSGASASSSSRSDTYTATGNGVLVNATAAPKQNFGLQVVQTGTVTAWTVVLEGSLDGITFVVLITHTEADGTGVTKYATGKPSLYYRSRCSALTLGAGTNVVATILGMQ